MRCVVSRMGRDVRSNAGLGHQVLKWVLLNLDKKIKEEPSYLRQRFLLLVGIFIIVCYNESLRRCEGFMREWSNLIRNISIGKYDEDIPHVVVPLLRRLNVELGERCHLVMMINNSSSRVNFRKWITRAVALLKHENFSNIGPVMWD